MNTEDAANHIFVNPHAEGQRNLLRNAGRPPAGITPFHFHDGVDECFIRSFWTGLVPTSGGKQQVVLSFGQHVVEMQQGGRLQHDGGTGNARRVHEKGTQAGDDTIRRPEVGSTLSAATEDPQLMFDEHRLGHDGTEAARAR